MLKGFAIAVICIGALVTVDHELNGGIYTDQVLGMLRQIGYSFPVMNCRSQRLSRYSKMPDTVAPTPPV